MESRKVVEMNLFEKQKQRHRCREQYMDNKGGRNGEMNWGIVIDIYMCVLYSVYILYIYTIDTINKIDN